MVTLEHKQRQTLQDQFNDEKVEYGIKKVSGVEAVETEVYANGTNRQYSSI